MLQFKSIACTNFLNESMFYLFVSFLLLYDIFALFFEQLVLFLAHLRVTQHIVVNEEISFE